MIVCVLGMHRSGTSAMAGLLHKNGITMGRKGEFYPPPLKENPHGFFENVRFRRVNDALLKEYGYRVKSFSEEIPFVHPPQNGSNLKAKMKELIMEKQLDFNNWGWKDPRTMLTIYPWINVLNELDYVKDLKIILMRRNIENIADSMRRRGNKEKHFHQFVDCALEYYNKCNFYLQFLDMNLYLRTRVIYYEDELLKAPVQTCKRLSGFLHYEISDVSHIIRKKK